MTPELSYIHSIAVSEVLMRSAKHVFTAYMQGLEMTHLSVAVSHFLNCMLCSASQVVKLKTVCMSIEYHYTERRIFYCYAVSCRPNLTKAQCMDELQLTGRNLGRVFNSRSGCVRAPCS